MKALVSMLILFGQCAVAQTLVKNNYPVQANQKINFNFDYPKLITLSTWDKNEVSITGSVSINNGENDNAFTISTSNSGGTLTIKGEINDMKNLPQRITIFRGDKKVTFHDKAQYKKYVEENGKKNEMISTGVDIEIELEIKVPKNVFTVFNSVYGMVEVKDFQGALEVVSTYGGVDAAMGTLFKGKLIAETNYGQIYSNLDVKFAGEENGDFHLQLTSELGPGPKQSFESKYGNVYLRKAN
jgi:hypothetical protein